MESLTEIILTSAVISAAVGSISGAFAKYHFDSLKQKFHTNLDALKLAVDLEGYVLLCADKLSNHVTAVQSDGSAGTKLTSIPNLPPLPVEVGLLQFKKPELAHRILILNQEYEMAKQRANFWWEVVGDQCCETNAIVNETAKLAYKIIQLTIDLRREFKLPSRDFIFGEFNVIDAIKRYMEE